MKPRIFIGSSTEIRPLAEALESLLAKDCAPTGWWNAFSASEFTLEALLNQIDDYDFGIFVFAPDDKVKIRGRNFWAPRDNVSLELGMFLAHLGRKRTLIVEARAPHQGRQDLRVPSDLHGLVFIPVIYKPGESDREREKNLREAAASAFPQLQKAISENGCRLKAPTLDRLKGLAARKGSDIPLYTFSGQYLRPRGLAGAAAFELTSVFKLWADPTGENSIRVSLEAREGRSCVRIRFEVQEGCLPSDVTLRPCGLWALDNPLSAPGLVLQALAPVSEANHQLEERGRHVGLAIRIIDGQGTQWKLQEDHHRKVFPIPVNDEWHEVKIGLDPEEWSLFQADGNHLFAADKPDFSVISAVIVEVGSWTKNTPSHGTGEVWISNLRLDE